MALANFADDEGPPDLPLAVDHQRFVVPVLPFGKLVVDLPSEHPLQVDYIRI